MAERERRLRAADRARRAWQQRHGITNPDWAEDHNSDGPGQPTTAQLAELELELRLISGQDPETGRYAKSTPAPAGLPARSVYEANLHMDLTPCPCGGGAGVQITGVAVEGGSRYTRVCRACGTTEEFVYRLPSVPYEPAGPVGFGYGGAQPSQLIDAAQWLWAADHFARAARDFPPEEREEARGMLRSAVAALDEVVKFVPPDDSRIPDAAVWTPMGRAVRESMGARLEPDRLAAAREAYLSALADLADRDEATGRSLGDPSAALTTFREIEAGARADQRRAGAVERALASWARRHSIDDGDWTEDGWTGQDRRRPTPEQAWEIVRETREIVRGA